MHDRIAFEDVPKEFEMASQPSAKRQKKMRQDLGMTHRTGMALLQAQMGLRFMWVFLLLFFFPCS
jgi:hypothetical protein